MMHNTTTVCSLDLKEQGPPSHPHATIPLWQWCKQWSGDYTVGLRHRSVGI